MCIGRCRGVHAGYISDGQTFRHSGRVTTGSVTTGSQPCLETGASIRGKRSKQLIYVALALGCAGELSVYYTVCVAVVSSRRSLPDPHVPQRPIPRVILAPRLWSAVGSEFQHTANIKMHCFADA